MGPTPDRVGVWPRRVCRLCCPLWGYVRVLALVPMNVSFFGSRDSVGVMVKGRSHRSSVVSSQKRGVWTCMQGGSHAATGAEVGVMGPPARQCHQELDEAGGTLPWSPRGSAALTPELTLLAPGQGDDHICLSEAPQPGALFQPLGCWSQPAHPQRLWAGESTAFSGGVQPSLQRLSGL